MAKKKAAKVRELKITEKLGSRLGQKKRLAKRWPNSEAATAKYFDTLQW